MKTLLGNWISGKESTIQGICVEYCALHADSYFSKNNKKRPVFPASWCSSRSLNYSKTALLCPYPRVSSVTK